MVIVPKTDASIAFLEALTEAEKGGMCQIPESCIEYMVNFIDKIIQRGLDYED